jgi:hypothetical protein
VTTNPDEYARDQLGQLGSDARGVPVSEQDLAAAALAGAGIGTTEVDVAALAAQIQAMQAQINQLNADRPPVASPLLGTVETLQGMLAGHGDVTAIELGKDLAEAAANAVKTGAVEYAERIGAKLHAWLVRHPPVPGENYHYRQALDFSGPHLEDALQTVTAPAPAAAALASAGGPPTKIIAGNVTG